MPFNVSNFRSQLEGGGARGNLFEVIMPFPGISNPGDAATKFTFMCKAASIPSSDIAPVEVPYFGRNIKLAGNRTFAEWSTTVINDEDFSIHSAMVNWMDRIRAHTENIQSGTVNDYQVDALVNQYSKDGQVIKTINFVNMWPNSLAGIDLAWDGEGIEEFAVTWQYDYWTVADDKAQTT